MKRIRTFLAVACLLITCLLAQKVSERARKIHFDAIVVDTHADTLQRVLMGKEDITQRGARGHLDLPRMREGGLDAEFFAVWVDSPFVGPVAVKRTLQLIDAMYRVIDQSKGQLRLALDASDIERNVKTGKLSALMGIEGGHAIDDDLATLRMYHRLGVRYMTLTWSNNNNWADSSGEPPRWNGVTEFGREVVREMNRIGMIVDISHVSDKTFWDVMKVTAKPVIASHSSASALNDVPRNMKDDMLRAVAKNGGVVGINFYSAFLSSEFAKASKIIQLNSPTVPDLMKKYGGDPFRVAMERYKIMIETPSPLPPPPFKILIDHIDHVAKVAGVDHVGLGSDFDGIDSAPEGMGDVTDLPKITQALLERGYSEADVKKILGGNFLRVLREVTGR
ncbi:MAG TPA: dipeptidase [Acidobacteriota bacterium]|jgi:membrane dipeptidase|nr:dipeptidase [Acidobacteriota bacterium]